MNAKADQTTGGINIFAMPTLVNINLLKESDFRITDGWKIFYLTIYAHGALNVSLQFNQFKLSKRSILSLYTKNELTDSITAKENNEYSLWATRVYHGDEINIVLKVPNQESQDVSININEVYFGFKPFGITPNFGSPGASNPCQVNVACPIGFGWENQRNSVAIINANGSYCSGALVMNTCGTNIPYFLTANHCVVAKPNVGTWVFQFLYYSTQCNSNTGYREDIQITGSTLRAKSPTSDFALLQLNQVPPASSGINYAGWRRNIGGGINPLSVVMLHHPKGDVMKISVDNNPPTPSFFGNAFCWQLGLDVGGAEGGSSGSPYFNQEHRIIGQHYGVFTVNANNPCHPEKFRGRFDVSWAGDGTNSTRLSNWLDPLSSGATTTNTTNIASLMNYSLSLSIDGDWFVCPNSSSTYTLNGVPGGLNINWAISNPTIASLTSSANQATVTYLADGNVTLTATVGNSSCLSNNVATRYLELGEKTLTDIIGLNPPLGVSPGELLELSVGALPNTPVQWSVEGGTILGSSTNSQVTIQVDYCSGYYVNGYLNVHCTFTHACGTGTYTEWTTVDCSTGGGGPLRVIPNPATGITSIDIQGSGKVIKEIKITDKIGNVLRRIRFSGINKKETIDVSSLPSDIYYVQVFDGKTWTGTHLSVRH